MTVQVTPYGTLFNNSCCLQCGMHAGYEDKELKFECTQHAILLQPQGSPPVVERVFDYSIDTSRPIDSFR